jgi:hypothetical protein
MLETLAERIHTHQPVGRALAVTLDHISNNYGYFEEQSELIQNQMHHLEKKGEGNFAHELSMAYAAAMAGREYFTKHVERVWDEWYEEFNPEPKGE